MEKIYIVTQCSEFENKEPIMCILGAYKEMTDAHKCMEEEFQECLEYLWHIDINNTEKVIESNKMCLYDINNYANSIIIEITEMDLK